MNQLLGHLRATALRARDVHTTDFELLEAYADRRDEMAFDLLMRRHGPTVLGVCRRIAGNGADAEDAFQATFLVLARKVHAIRPRSALAGWLYGVAMRAALKVRAQEARRRIKERKVTTMPRPVTTEYPCPEEMNALHRELGRLPAELRAPIVLCELEGKTRAVAARQLGWPEGTVASRLARGRRLLARRLKSSGPAVVIPLVSVVVPARLFARTLNVATQFAAGSKGAAAAVFVAEEVIKDMLLTKLTKTSAILLAVITATAIGFGFTTSPMAAAPASKPSSGASDLASALKTARPINVGLLEQDEVLADLKVTMEQRRSIADVLKVANDEYQEAMKAAFRPLPQGGGMVRMSTPPSIKYDHAKLAATLKPEQLVRVRQLELHLRGPSAFADRRVIRALRLTAEQELKIEEIIIKYEPEIATTTMEMIRGGKESDPKPMAELSEKAVTQCRNVLDKEQRASWDWLAGKRPVAGQWVRAVSPSNSASVFGTTIAVQGMPAGAIRVLPGVIGVPAAPALPAPPGVVIPPPPVKVEKKE